MYGPCMGMGGMGKTSRSRLLLGAAGFTERTRERFQALHRDQRVCVLTSAGISLGLLNLLRK